MKWFRILVFLALMSESDDIIRFVLSWFLSPFSPSAAASSLLFALWDAPRHSRRAIHSIGKDRFPAAPPAQDVTDGPFDLALPWHGPSLCRPSRQVKRNPGQLRAKPWISGRASELHGRALLRSRVFSAKNHPRLRGSVAPP